MNRLLSFIAILGFASVASGYPPVWRDHGSLPAHGISAGAGELIFPDSDGWDFLYTSEDATTTTWAANTGADLTSANTQSVTGDTTGLNDAAIGNDRVDAAAETVFDSTNAGWRSNGTDKATISSGTFTLRLLANLRDASNLDGVFEWWTSSTSFIRLEHSSIASIRFNVRVPSALRTYVPAGIIGNWALIDLYVEPGVGLTARVNGTETVFADVNVGDVTAASGTGGDIGIGVLSGGSRPCDAAQTFIGVGAVAGDLGLTRHNADVSLLGL